MFADTYWFRSSDLIHRELIENSNAPKHQKISSTDHTQLVELLVAKDAEMKSVLKLAEEQAHIQQKMIALEAKVDMRVSLQRVHINWFDFSFDFTFSISKRINKLSVCSAVLKTPRKFYRVHCFRLAKSWPASRPPVNVLSHPKNSSNTRIGEYSHPIHLFPVPHVHRKSYTWFTQNKRIECDFCTANVATRWSSTTISYRHWNALGFPWQIRLEYEWTQCTGPNDTRDRAFESR